MTNHRVLVWHSSATNDVIANSNMAAVAHDEHIIVFVT